MYVTPEITYHIDNWTGTERAGYLHVGAAGEEVRIFHHISADEVSVDETPQYGYAGTIYAPTPARAASEAVHLYLDAHDRFPKAAEVAKPDGLPRLEIG